MVHCTIGLGTLYRTLYPTLYLFLSLATIVAQDNEAWVDFTPSEWLKLEKSIDHGLDWLAEHQNRDGSIAATSTSAQPAVTALATMAFLSRGHQPGQGPYGQKLEKAIDYVLSTQDRFGFFVTDTDYSHHGSTYSHAIAGVMLAEALGMTTQRRNERISRGIQRALDATVKLQRRHHNDPGDRGGWRYIRRNNSRDADLSVTTWHLLFLRAAKNANYDIPEVLVKDATRYVQSCFYSERGQFSYYPGRKGTITMTGAGVLCLFLAGQFDDIRAATGIQTLKDYNFRSMGTSGWPYYTCYHCSQAASQAGGDARKNVLREIAEYLLDKQSSDGSWPTYGSARFAGEGYSTSLAILSLTPSYQILPIYQH